MQYFQQSTIGFYYYQFLLSAQTERFFVSRMPDFIIQELPEAEKGHFHFHVI